MPIATSPVGFIALVALASPPAAHLLATQLPISITVAVEPDISSSAVSRALTEASDIWRAAGFTFMWKHESTTEHAEERSPLVPRVLRLSSSSSVHVTFGHTRDARPDESALPLGWIKFDDRGAPGQRIYLSYANAITLMERTRESNRQPDWMTPAERDELLGRALGRALAHELGHYLLASKAHSATGLMRARHPAAEFFRYARERGLFDIDVQQRQIIVARLMRAMLLAASS